MQAIGDKMFFESNPFDAIKKRTDLNGHQKIRELLVLNQSDTERDNLNAQAIPILKDPRILQTAIEANKRILTPLWFELLEEARMDGSIQTEYTKELSELLPLVNFWLMPSIYPATAEEIQHKYLFVIEVLAKMGLPIMDDKTTVAAEKFLRDISPKQKAVVLSILGAFETPTIQACVPQMQTDDNIIKGNAAVNQIAAVST